MQGLHHNISQVEDYSAALYVASYNISSYSMFVTIAVHRVSCTQYFGHMYGFYARLRLLLSRLIEQNLRSHLLCFIQPVNITLKSDMCLKLTGLSVVGDICGVGTGALQGAALHQVGCNTRNGQYC